MEVCRTCWCLALAPGRVFCCRRPRPRAAMRLSPACPPRWAGTCSPAAAAVCGPPRAGPLAPRPPPRSSSRRPCSSWRRRSRSSGSSSSSRRHSTSSCHPAAAAASAPRSPASASSISGVSSTGLTHGAPAMCPAAAPSAMACWCVCTQQWHRCIEVVAALPTRVAAFGQCLTVHAGCMSAGLGALGVFGSGSTEVASHLMSAGGSAW